MAKQKNIQPVQEEKVEEKEVQIIEEVVEPASVEEETVQPKESPVEVQNSDKNTQEEGGEVVDTSQVRVIKIVQKTPSGYRLLLETGEIVKVSKKDYRKGQEFISL